MSPAQLPGIGGEEAGVEARFPGTRQEGDGQFVIVGHVQLVETGGSAVRCADCFDRGGACGGEGVGKIQFFRYCGDG